jgi:phosphoenolpyruvate synthase/pyruvate phosphate dikinase
MHRYVLTFEDIDHTQGARVGGKGANLGELSRIEGVRVPAGFCVTTDAFARMMADVPSIAEQLERLSRVKPNDRDAIRGLAADIRRSIETTRMPDDIAAAVTRALARLGDDGAYAVRSSATAEDLPTASFAGQQDTYLNVVGPAAILEHVSRCWASLFTERAVTYRLHNGFDHRRVHMAVVVQRMVASETSGILFTADPVTGNRKVASVEASFGLGEALVAGLVNPDIYQVRDDTIIATTIAAKQRAIRALATGGTHTEAIDAEQQTQPALTDAHVLRLVQLGRRIEAHFGRPQDIEWCFANEDFYIVQSRPITTLFPIPTAGDEQNHVYVSVGHQQMMTDAMKPLGLSMWQLTTARPMYEAAGRLFVDVAADLASPTSRARLLGLWRSDPLVGGALENILERGNFIQALPDDPSRVPPLPSAAGGATPIPTDPTIVAGLVERNAASVAAMRSQIATRSGSELLDFILADIQNGKRILFDPLSHQAIMAGMEAMWWLNDNLQAWLGEKSAADTLIQSVPNNVTSEMGLALLDVADAIRPHADVVAFLRQVEDDDFLNRLPAVAGGREARDAIQAWLDKYGMRGVGEIDITRPRWSERPAMLLPILLSHVENFQPGEAARRFEQGRQEASRKEQELLTRLRALPDGDQKAEETKRMIDRVRTFAGYREYPKYGKVNRDFVYKQALMREAERLVRAGVLRHVESIFFLRFEELQEVVRTNHVDEELLRQREDSFKSYQSLTPPRVMTSEGEIVTGAYKRDNVPAGALAGLPVSTGTVEGRARVVLDIAEANLEAGDILVTAYTDPSWTPLFVAITGLVTEVGGLMTHGAVIAREYGVPAVVGVERATQLIHNGQWIRVHGSEGYVELLGTGAHSSG